MLFIYIKEKFMQNRKIFISIFFLCACFFIFLISEHLKDSLRTKCYNKAIIIGVDGMDYRLMSKMLKENKLPNLKNLNLQKLESVMPPHSPVAWTSIACGVNPGKHNIFDFIVPDFEAMNPELSLLHQTQTILGTKYKRVVPSKFFWEYLEKENIDCEIYFWPLTFPAFKGKTKIISGMGVPDISGSLGNYVVFRENLENKDIDDNEKGITFINDRAEIKLEGPYIGKKRISATLEIERGVDRVNIITSDYSKCSLVEGEWSQWIKLVFTKDTFFKTKVSAICKIHINKIKPFDMFVSSCHFDPETPLFRLSNPSGFAKNIVKQYGLYGTLGMPEETNAYVDGVLSEQAFIDFLNLIDVQRNKILLDAVKRLKTKDTGVVAMIYGTSSALQHIAFNSEQGKNLIEDYFYEKDRLIGEIIEHMEGDTTLIVLSASSSSFRPKTRGRPSRPMTLQLTRMLRSRSVVANR